MSSGENWPRDFVLSAGVRILFIAMNLACVITAFYDGLKSGSWQGKVAIVLAILVVVLILPLSIPLFIDFIQFHLTDWF